MPSLSLSTVYRIVESFEKEGLIRRIGASNGIARYDGNLLPHQHLVCRSCDRMTDLNEGSFSRLRLPGGRLEGFVAEELDIRIVGICPECRRSGANPSGSPQKGITGRRTVSRKKEKS
jgi:Fur family transcriptional regulator, peroxide stress response regulator